jgi:hypothetical protein
LLKLIKQPVVVLVDDIDRCEGPSVVRLLEGIYTVFGTLNIVFVIVGDGRWIARAFEKAYLDEAPAETHRADAIGKPLGSLFLEKIFQFSATVPEMPAPLKGAFWRKLLKVQSSGSSQTAAEGDMRVNAEKILENLRTEESIIEAVKNVAPSKEPEWSRALRDAAVRRLAEADLIENPSEHVLVVFEELVEPNPRAMKRQIMAYGMARASDLASFRDTDQGVLAAWSVLESTLARVGGMAPR